MSDDKTWTQAAEKVRKKAVKGLDLDVIVRIALADEDREERGEFLRLVDMHPNDRTPEQSQRLHMLRDKFHMGEGATTMPNYFFHEAELISDR